ncbi:sensor histidine kinase [Gracilibacillus salinarum]|uniref:histidine kinase n=1 Tax=Gracilibacillus salinarum TaxID=2932255 RepID=A0ABY4GRC5_9BACI|nr:sensor histidine kinase [Gracilibacillus salinarum]UOQ86920.1 sensor histidine kinase [Gracilibacillus salinarum]
MQSSNSIQNQVEQYLNQNISVTNMQVDRFLKDYELITLPMVTDENVKRYLDLNSNQAFDRYEIYTEITNKMREIQKQNPAIDILYIITDSGHSVLSENRYYAPTIPFPTDQVYDYLKKEAPDSGKVVITPRKNIDGELVITYTRKIRDKNFQPRGILGVDISFQTIMEYWSVTDMKEGSKLMIVDDEGKLIYHPDSSLFGTYINEEVQLQLNKKEKGSFFSSSADNEMFYYYHTSDYTNWKTVITIPKSELFRPISNIRTTTIVTGTLAVLIALILGYNFTRRIVRPIRILQKHLKKMEKGIWTKVPIMNGTDEMIGLVNSYNQMIDELKKLIDKVYYTELNNQKTQLKIQQRELEWQKNELHALQAQINPHFLYNTLETINAYAVIKGADEISEMADSLAYMFRYSVKNLEVVTIVEELEHVRNYLTIHEHRMQENIALDIKIDPDQLLKDAVKLSLQPLVENAIGHGFNKGLANGKITIDAKEKDDLFYIMVEDNGTGIKKSRLEELELQLKNNPTHIDTDGIGLQNVHRRIQLIFGEEYGIQIESKEDCGTKIIIVIPNTKKT